MAVRRLDIHRRDKGERALVTLLGEVGPATAPLLRAALEQCLRDGMTVIDVDLTTVGSCDAKGLDVFLTASRRAERVHAALRLHHPCAQITRLLAVTGSAPLLLAAPAHPVPPRCSMTWWARLRRLRRPEGHTRPATVRLRRWSKTGFGCAG